MFSTPLSMEIFAPAEMGEPLERNVLLFGEFQGSENAPAFRLGERTQVLAGIPQQHDACHAFGILVGEVANDADDDVGLVLAIRTIDRDQPALGIEIVLDELAGRKLRSVSSGAGVSILTIS